VSYQAHSPAEWAAFLSLAVGIASAASVPFQLTVDADLADFDPRPVVRRAAPVVHQALVFAGHDLNRAIGSARHELNPLVHYARHTAYTAREAARDLAALLILLATSPKGSVR
jgi:hypothetical protein